MALSIIKKITIASVNSLGVGGFKKKFLSELPGATFNDEKELTGFPTFLGMRVVGIAKSMRTGTGTYGDWVAFIGEFMAYDREGDEYRAPQLILPEPANSMLADAMTSNPDTPIEVGFDIMVKFDKGERGYQYQCRPLMEVQQSDPLLALANKLNAGETLPAPVTQQVLFDAEGREVLGDEEVAAPTPKTKK